MPSSRQRVRRGSHASGGRCSPPSSPSSPSAALSASLSTSTPKRKDEFIPIPSKKRRVDNSAYSADEDDLNSPIMGKRLWETFESDYKFLMEEDIIRTCRTGDQFGEDPVSSSSKVSLTEFLQQFSELSQWLAKLEARRPAASSARVERYLDQGFAEELLQRQPRKKLLHDYACELLQRHPQMEAEIAERLGSLEAQWSAAEQQNAGLAALVDPELVTQILTDIGDDVADLEAWLCDLTAGLPNSNEWMQMIMRLGPKELKERQMMLQKQQADIESRSRSISHVLKLILKLKQEGVALTEPQAQQLSDFLAAAQGLEDRCHAAWLQSLEILYCTEQQLDSPRQPAAPRPPAAANGSETDDRSAIANFIAGNMGVDSVDCSGRSNTKESSPSSIEPPLRSKSTSFDILPFSEDEYEKITASSSSMRCQSIDLQDEAGRAAASKTALLAADMCYDDPDLARGIRLHRETTREISVHRQDGTANLPGPVTGDSSSSHFLSEWELSSTEWRTSDSAQLFGGVSRSAEVLLGEELDLDVSQVHAVLSVTPKKAYYRMTALDSELTGDSMSRPPPTSVSAPEGFNLMAERRGVDTDEEVETLVSPDGSPVFLTSTPSASGVVPGQKRRYSRSFCPAAGEAVNNAFSPVTAGHVREAEGLTRLREKSTSDSSAVEPSSGRSGSWRELIGPLERAVRLGGSGGNLLLARPPDDDTGSLADESASSGAGDSSGQRSGPNRMSGGRLRRIRHRAPGNEERRRSNSMLLAEKAEKIVAAAHSRSLHDDTDSQGSEEFDEADGCAPVTEESLEPAWDNYQSPMYPSGCDDDGEEEEKLDLMWDEQLEASIHDRIQRRREHQLSGNWDDDDAFIEEMLSRSLQILERARNSLGTAPPPEVLTSELAVLSGGGSVSIGGHNSDAAELDRELSRQEEWLRACETNLTCLDHLKESLTDSGVEDDLDPIRQQVEHLCKEWTAFKEETLARLRLIETLRHVHEEADVVKREAQRLADLMDAPAQQKFEDRAQLDKFISVLEYYLFRIPEWRQSVQVMHQNVLGSLENDQVDYLDVRKCYAENLHLLSQWLFSLYSRSDALLLKMAGVCEQHTALLSLLRECDEAIGREEHLLRCTRLAADLIEPSELETSCHDLQVLSRRLLAIGDNLDECLREASRLSVHFSPNHWQHMDSRLTCTANRLALLQEACAALLSDMSVKLQAQAGPEEALLVTPEVKRRSVGTSASTAALAAIPPVGAIAPCRRRKLWRFLRASLPYQLALLVLFGCFYYLFADYSGFPLSLLLSPQLRHKFGSPY